ncbi:MAG TPA: hypothetical protein PK493_16945, partial [Pseudomonadota bacterium]|nr:hypothetical protein [Pseudomonadota bacterium]
MRRATLYLFVSLFAVAGCKKDAAKQPNPATAQQKTVRVETAKAVKHTFSGRLPITGELKPAQEVVLKSKVGGTVVVLN